MALLIRILDRPRAALLLASCYLTFSWGGALAQEGSFSTFAATNVVATAATVLKMLLLVALALQGGRLCKALADEEVSPWRAWCACAGALLLPFVILSGSRDAVAAVVSPGSMQLLSHTFVGVDAPSLTTNLDRHRAWVTAWDSGAIPLLEASTLLVLSGLFVLIGRRFGRFGSAAAIAGVSLSVLLALGMCSAFGWIEPAHDTMHSSSVLGPLVLELMIPVVVFSTESPLAALLLFACALATGWLLRPRRRVAVLPIALLCIAVVGVGAPHARGQEISEPDFDEALAEVSTAMDRGKWDEAQERILALLEEHAGAEYVRPHLEALRQDLRRAAFWSEAEEPELASLVSGELLAYKRSTGYLKIRYTKDTLGDFERHASAYVHPTHFRGSWSVEIEGTPDEVARAGYGFLGPDGKGYAVRFGKRIEGSFLYTRHVLMRSTRSGGSRIGSAEPPEIAKEKEEAEIEAEIDVGKRSIRATYERKRAFDHDHDSDDLGSLVLIADTEAGFGDPFGEITLVGEVDPGWVSGILDRAVAEQRAAFDAGWRDPKAFDAWKPSSVAPAEELSRNELFARVQFELPVTGSVQERNLENIRETLAKGKRGAEAILAKLDGIPSASLGREAVAWARLSCALLLDRPSLALEQLDTLQVDPGSKVEAKMLRAQLLQSARRLDESVQVLERILEEHPKRPQAYVLLAENLLLRGDAAEAHAVVLRGRGLLPASELLRKLEIKVVKAARGPEWQRAREEVGDHFVVHYEGERSQARLALRTLEEAWERCVDAFGPLSDPPDRPTHVYLFSGQASYLGYVDGVADNSSENTLGIYNVLLKQIAAWDLPDQDQLLDTLRHECAHRYLDLRLAGRIPRWLNEGLAEVFAASWDERGQWKPGRLRNERLEAFSRITSLSGVVELMREGEEKFLEDVEASYTQAWALVHFLSFGEARDRALLDRLLESLAAGKDPQVALDDALDGVDPEDLQRRFGDWLLETVRARMRGR